MATESIRPLSGKIGYSSPESVVFLSRFTHIHVVMRGSCTLQDRIATRMVGFGDHESVGYDIYPIKL